MYCENCGLEVNPKRTVCKYCKTPICSNYKSTARIGKKVAVLAYFPIFGFLVAIIKHQNNKTKLGAYHLKQVTGFILTGIIIMIMAGFFIWWINNSDKNFKLNYAVWVAIGLIIIFVCFLISYIIGFNNASEGRKKPAPVLGKLYENLFKDLYK